MPDLAHGVGRVYESPIPLSLYLIGAAATVLVSFLIRILARELRPLPPERRVARQAAARAITLVLRNVALVGLFLTVLSAVVVRERGLTLAPLLFWVGLVVGMVVMSAIIGGVWEAANPWDVVESFYRLEEADATQRSFPWWTGPALLFGLFWFELVSGVGFESIWILIVILGYSLFAFTFRRSLVTQWNEVDPFAILFGFASRSAPLGLRPDGIYYKGFIRDLDVDDPMPKALFASLFVLLASTTLDNVRETVGWTDFLQTLGVNELADVLVDTVALAGFAALFFAPFAASVGLSSKWLGRGRSFSDTSRRFGWSLVPIGIAYVIAHNAPLLITGIPRLIAELSDPFDLGWNLLGTADLNFIPSPALVWFIEIAVIVGGHILGVLVAHRTAVRVSVEHAGAVRSQYALTGLMALFTITTLWLLSQPLVA